MDHCRVKSRDTWLLETSPTEMYRWHAVLRRSVQQQRGAVGHQLVEDVPVVEGPQNDVDPSCRCGADLAER